MTKKQAMEVVGTTVFLLIIAAIIATTYQFDKRFERRAPCRCEATE